MIVGICVAVFLLITFVVCGLFMRFGTDPREVYQMTETYIRTGTGKNASSFSFKRVKIVTITKKYIGLKGKIGNIRIYAPDQDLTFVKNYILRRVPSEAEIRYE